MPLPATIDVCRTDLFTPEEELREKYRPITVEHVMRIRDMYAWYIANPESKDKVFIDEFLSRYRISRALAYSDLGIIKTLLPLLSSASRDFHRWKFNEMILETYQMAKKRKDTKTMERAAASYAKYNRVDLEDEQQLPYDLIVVQPFCATSDPSVLGIKPIPNLQEKIDSLLEKYGAESMDIEDVDFEEVDLEEDDLFGENPASS